jgi:Rha family phage regulatory protein
MTDQSNAALAVMKTGVDAHRQPVVFVRDGEVFASSLDVAAFFEKAHKHVLAAIDKLLEQEPSLHGLNFRPMLVDVAIGNGATRQDRAFALTRDGFALVAMGFTGAKALKWKLRYIEAFNCMEAELRSRPAVATAPALTAQETGGIIKAVVGKALAPILDQVNRLAALLAERAGVPDPSMAVTTEFRAPLDVLVEAGVPARHRRGLVLRASAQLRTFCATHGMATAIRKDLRGRWVFQVDAIAAWLAAGGSVLIAAHKAQMAGQTVLPFRRPKPESV